jgi:hypothetical protein
LNLNNIISAIALRGAVHFVHIGAAWEGQLSYIIIVACSDLESPSDRSMITHALSVLRHATDEVLLSFEEENP